MSGAPGSSAGLALDGVCVSATGVAGAVVEEWATAITAPMPTPTASARPRTIQCSRRDTPPQVWHRDGEPDTLSGRGRQLIPQRHRDPLESERSRAGRRAGAPRLGRAARPLARLRRAAARHGRLGRRRRGCASCSTSSTSSRRTSLASTSTPRPASTPMRWTPRRTTSRRSRATGPPTSRASSSSSSSSGSRSTMPRPTRCSRPPSSSRTGTGCGWRGRRSRTSCPRERSRRSTRAGPRSRPGSRCTAASSRR